MHHLPLLIFILPLHAALAIGETHAPDFSRYPQTDAFKFFTSTLTNTADHTNLLTITSFLGNDRVALLYSVSDSGWETDCRFVYHWAVQSSHQEQLAEPDLKNLRSAIRDLPADSTSPPIDRLLIVTFREGSYCVVRTYDRGNLPKPMRRINIIARELM